MAAWTQEVCRGWWEMAEACSRFRLARPRRNPRHDGSYVSADVTPSPFAGGDLFDPLEEAVRLQVRGFIEELLEEELEAALGRGRYERQQRREGAPPWPSNRASW